jgi:hypothetical protein
MICKKVFRGFIEWFCPVCTSITAIQYEPAIEKEE